MKRRLPKINVNRKRLATLLMTLVVVGVTIIVAINAVANWFDSNTIRVQSPLVVEVNTAPMIVVTERKTEIVRVLASLDEIVEKEAETPIEEYICRKWGVADCKLALAVARAESGMRDDAININVNGTVDLGIYQINSIHYNKPGCGLAEVATPEGNVDCAYKIWQASGWNAWVAYNRGMHLAHLE